MKTEVRRGRKFVEYIDDSLPVGTFVQEIGMHDVSYQDEQGTWHPADENWATDGVDGFVLKNDKLNHKIRLKGNGGRTWYPRRNVNTEYMTFGVPQYWNGKRWANFSFSGWSVEGKTITLNTRQNVTILVHNRWDGIKIDWVLASSAAPSRMRYPVSLTGITEISGVLFGADGSELGRLTPTTAMDANEAELACSGSYANGYVEFQADVTGAVYPVTVDPDFAGGTADCVITGSCSLAAGWSTARSTSTSIGAGTPAAKYVGYYNSNSGTGTARYMYRAYELFDTSAIGAGSTVSQVNLRLVCLADQSTVVDFDVRIAKYDWSELAGDLTNATKRETAYDGLLAADADSSIWRNTNGISTNTQYTSGNLSTKWVNKTGTTYYGLIADFDQDDSEPAAGYSRITIANAGNATESYRPCLIVTYEAGVTLSCAAGSYSLTGTAATLTYTGSAQNLTLSCGAGSLALTGSACTLSVKRNFVLSCAAGSYTQTGTSASFEVKRNYVLACAAGSYALTGTDASFITLRNYTLACGVGSYSQTGVDATFVLQRHFTLACAEGSYTQTGTDISLVVQRNFVLACNPGSYSLTGTDASFVTLRNYSLACDAGYYSLTGTDCTLTYTTTAQSLTLACNAGLFTLTGTDSVLTSARTMALAPGSYSLTGTDSGLFKGLIMPCESGSYELDGSLANLFKSLILTTESGTYLLTGTDADLLYTKYFPYAEFWDGTVTINTLVDGNVILNQAIDGSVTIENPVYGSTSGLYWGSSYWGNSYWSAYWGGLVGSNGINEIVERIVKLNRAINESVILNREVTDSYSELEENKWQIP